MHFSLRASIVHTKPKIGRSTVKCSPIPIPRDSWANNEKFHLSLYFFKFLKEQFVVVSIMYSERTLNRLVYYWYCVEHSKLAFFLYVFSNFCYMILPSIIFVSFHCFSFSPKCVLGLDVFRWNTSFLFHLTFFSTLY